MTTHWDTCWQNGGPSHYQCAVAFIERLLSAQCRACDGKGGFNQAMEPGIYWVQCTRCSGTGREVIKEMP